MKDKIFAFLICLPVLFMSAIPRMDFSVPIMANSNLWFWLVVLSGILGFLFIFTQARLSLKLLLIYLYINCFMSKAPYLSFTSYIAVVACFYYYVLCLKLKDRTWVFRVCQSIFFVNILLLVMQLLGYDKLMNFGQDSITYFGVIGNPMQLVSFLIILTAILLPYHKLNVFLLGIISVLAVEIIGVLAAFTALFFLVRKSFRAKFILSVILLGFSTGYILLNNTWHNFFYSRFPVWIDTLTLASDHPYFGWGIGVYQKVFPALSTGMYNLEGVWVAAHNIFLHLYAEIGSIGLFFFLLFIVVLFHDLIMRKKHLFICGMVMIFLNVSVYFPDRRIQCVPLLILFLAMCEREVNHDTVGNL